MNIAKLLFLLTLILASLSFSSCSGDDDNIDGGNIVDFGPKNVFTGDLPKNIGSLAIKYNVDGLLQEMSNSEMKVTFEYSSKLKSTADNNIIIMRYIDLNYPEESYTVDMKIGNNGFVSSAIQTYADNSSETWEFKYNSDNQLNYMKRSEGDNEVTTITYAGGNITNVKMEGDDKEEGIYTSSITYTSDKYPAGIENKGCIMLFDMTFGIDLDEMDYAYYAGLLGRATKKLPLKMTDGYVGEPEYDSTYIFDWTLNEKGYPTKFSYDDYGYTENLNFNW